MDSEAFKEHIMNFAQKKDLSYENTYNILDSFQFDIKRYHNTYFQCCEYLMKTNKNKAIVFWDYYWKKIEKHVGVMSRLFDALVATKKITEAQKIFTKICETYPNNECTIKRKHIIETELNKNYNIKIVSKNQKIFFDDHSKKDTMFNDKCKNIVKYKLILYQNKSEKKYDQAKYFKISNSNLEKIKKSKSNKITIKLNLLTCKQVEFFKSDGNLYDVLEINVKEILNYIEGYNGFLFLSNDTNQSIEQYTGKKLIEKDDLTGWEEFFNYFSKINNSLCLISPSKESVFPQYYPFSRGSITPIDQLLEVGRQINILYPYDILKNTEMSYSTIDTHWTDYGAYSVFKKILDMFNISIDHEFKFIERNIYGDLGSKCNPLRLGKYLYLEDFDLDKNLEFTNHITSTGELRIYQNKNSIIDKTVYLSGSSFSYILRKFFIATFKRVVFIRCPTEFYFDFVDYEKANITIFETTERFIIKCPKIIESKNINACIYKRNIDIETIKQLNNINVTKKDLYSIYLNEYKKLINSTL